MTGTELSALLDRIKALEESFEALMSGGVARTEEPEIRVRIAHTHTKADGWRCNETTVEWTGRGVPDWYAIATHLEAAHGVGSAQAADRNREDAEAKAA